MSFGQQIPLGRAIPQSQHAVSASMPTLDDVIGYEEKDPRLLAQLTTGYPRFVVHPFLKKIETHWQSLFDCPQHSIWLVSSERVARRLQARLQDESATLLKHRGVSGLKIRNHPDLNRDAKLFLQHIGGFLSTRHAEDYLVAENLLESAFPEAVVQGDPAAGTLEVLAPLLDVEPDAIVLTSNGMSAFFAAFEAARSLQSPAGRSSWIKLGWLYVDTMNILDKLSGPDADNVELLDVFDLPALERVLEQRGDSIAGIVTEAPTNPLIQTMDLARIRELATRYGAYLIVDPTVCSPANVDVSPYADVIVNSLTKYAGNQGDVMLGAVTATRQCPQREELLRRIRENAEPAYARDLARLSYQISNYEVLVEASNRNTLAVVDFLESHPKVRRVFWAKQTQSRANFERIARGPDCVGGLISFEYDGPLAEFYDHALVPKGPSFGMNTSLLCPFIILAHYNLVTSSEGRKLLAKAGIQPELLRLAIGSEPAEEIVAALKAGLDRS